MKSVSLTVTVSIIIIRSSKICTIQRDAGTLFFISHLSACNKGKRTFDPLLIKQNSFPCVCINSVLICCVRSHTDIFRFIQIYFIIASYVPLGGKKKPSFEQTAETGMLSNAGEEEEVVETLLPMKAAKEEVLVDPEDETEFEDNTNVGESRSVITR